MAWVVVDSENKEYVHQSKPFRVWLGGMMGWESGNHGSVKLPKGTIKKIIGRELTWNDEPVELK